MPSKIDSHWPSRSWFNGMASDAEIENVNHYKNKTLAQVGKEFPQ